MFFSKRREPSGGFISRGQPKQWKDDKDAIHDRTLHLLRNGSCYSEEFSPQSMTSKKMSPNGSMARTQAPFRCSVETTRMFSLDRLGGESVVTSSRDNLEMVTSDSETMCFICMVGVHETDCCHCSRKMCDMCSRQCDLCQEVFCTFCSTPNYEERYDRTFCLDCNVVALKAQRNDSYMEDVKATVDDVQSLYNTSMTATFCNSVGLS